jgi:hypothetical protein
MWEPATGHPQRCQQNQPRCHLGNQEAGNRNLNPLIDVALKDGPEACHHADGRQHETRNAGQEQKPSPIVQDRIDPLRQPPRQRGIQKVEDGGYGKYAQQANHQQPHETRSAPERRLVRGFVATYWINGASSHQHSAGESRFGTSYIVPVEGDARRAGKGTYLPGAKHRDAQIAKDPQLQGYVCRRGERAIYSAVEEIPR